MWDLGFLDAKKEDPAPRWPSKTCWKTSQKRFWCVTYNIFFVLYDMGEFHITSCKIMQLLKMMMMVFLVWLFFIYLFFEDESQPNDWWKPDSQALRPSSLCPAPPLTQSLWPFPLWTKLQDSQSWVLQILIPWLNHFCIIHHALWISSMVVHIVCQLSEILYTKPWFICSPVYLANVLFKKLLIKSRSKYYRPWHLFKTTLKTSMCHTMYVKINDHNMFFPH